MDEYSNRRVVEGSGFSRRGTIAFRDNHVPRGTQFCNRIGCSTRHDSLTGSQTGKPEKKLSRPAFLSTSSRTTLGSTSRISCNLNNHGKSHRVPKNSPSLQEKISVRSSSSRAQRDPTESNIPQEEPMALDTGSTAEHVQRVPSETDSDQSSILQEFTINMTEKSRRNQTLSNLRNQKTSGRKIGCGNEVTASSLPVRHSCAPRNSNHLIRPSQNQVGTTQKDGLRNTRCTSMSDVLPSACSSSDARQNKRMDTLRKRYIDVENTAAKGKRVVGSSSKGNPDSSRAGPSGLSLLEKPSAQQGSRTRSQLTSRDSAFSVRTRRSVNGDSRVRSSEQNIDDTFLLSEPVMGSPIAQTQFSLNEPPSSSTSRSFSTYIPPRYQSYSGQPGSSSGTSRTRSMVHSEGGDARTSHNPLVDRVGYRHLNMEGIEEMLLALERIEQDEELTYEQLTVLQSNLFFGGLAFHDQHREWRLDIDNMSYEELLALEEKMGSVSTALSEEDLSKCIRRGIYSGLASMCKDTDDVKCSICQEEYIGGDEIGKLHCDHRYHVLCIHQWLRQKNWCPICKSSARPS